MTPWLSRTAAALVLLLASLPGCGDGESTSGDTTTTTGSTTEVPACASDPRVQTYAVGLRSKSADGAIEVTFVDADPSPPAKGNNTWTVQILPSTPEGPTLQDPTIETIAYMPDHGHTSPIKPTATKVADDTYEIKPVSLSMPGVWEVTLKIADQGGASYSVKFTFCIAG